MDRFVLDRTDLVLLMLLAPDSKGQLVPLHGITRLQKLLYLVKQETNIELAEGSRFEFKAYKYGPFAQELYEVVDFLENAEFVSVGKGQDEDIYSLEEAVPIAEEIDPGDEYEIDIGSAPPYDERIFGLTPDGRKVAEGLKAQLLADDWSQIKDIKHRYGDRSLTSLLVYVYRTYPNSASETELKHLL